jgi:tetratricopeptide (TPR) repeat protein
MHRKSKVTENDTIIKSEHNKNSEDLSLLIERGLKKQREGLFQEAYKIYNDLLKNHPQNTDTLQLIGTLLCQQKKYSESLKFFEKVLEINPNLHFVYNNKGIVLKELNKLNESKLCFEKAIQINPKYRDAYNNLGIVCMQLKKLSQSCNYFNKAIELDPKYAEAYNNRGNVNKANEQFENALSDFDQAIKLNPNYAEAYYNRGVTLKALNRLDQALDSYDKAIFLNPHYADAYNNRGSILKIQKKFDMAIDSYQKAIQIKPKFSQAYNNLGNLYRQLNRLDEAVESYQKAIQINPSFAEAYNNFAITMGELGNFESSFNFLSKAIALNPNFSDAYWNKSLLNLLLGNYEEGWKLYEWRRKNDDTKHNFPNYEQPLWLGDFSIVGKTILVHSEQGLGDTIQFCRYLPMLEELNPKEIIFVVEKPLISIIATLNAKLTIIEKGKQLPSFDCYCPLLSMPLAFKTSLETVPAVIPYLKEDQVKQIYWAKKLGVKDLPRVGLVWSGSTAHKNDHNRSLRVSELSSLIRLPYEFHCLQKEIRECDKKELAKFKRLRLHHEDLKDFSDTAALIEQMDVVISVDTSVAHLAGALGKRVIILLPFMPDYRWMLDRDDTPWYPSAKLMRQKKIDDWKSVIKSLDRELRTLFLDLHKNNQYQKLELSPDLKDLIQKALVKHKSGILDEAKIDYLDILRINPQNFDALQLMATLLSQQKHYSEAIRYFDKALKLKPDFAAGYNNRGIVLKALKLFDEAILSFKQAVIINPNYAESFNNWGNTLKDLGDLDGAVNMYNKAIELNSTYSEAYNNRAIILKEVNRLEESVDSCNKAISLNPQYPEAHNNLAIALALLNRKDEALVHYRIAIQLNPNFVLAYLNYGSLLIKNNHINEALDCFEKVTLINPDNFEAHYQKGLILMKLSRHEESLKSLLEAMRINSSNADLYNDYAKLMIKMTRRDEALQAFDKAISLKPGFLDAYHNRAVLLKNLNRVFESIESFNKTVELSPNSPDVYINLGNALGEFGRLNEALANYDKAIELNPKSSIAYFNRGCALKKLNKLEDALASYKLAIELNPDHEDSYNNLGGVLQDLNCNEEALDCYEQVLKINPKYAQAYSNRGVILSKQNRLHEALENYKTAITLKPDYADPYLNQGVVFKSLGFINDALESYEKAISLDSNCIKAYWNKSLLNLLLGNYEEGWKLYEWRRKNDDTKHNFPNYEQPLWLGDFSIVGKTILVHSEQGLGDTIQFCRYLPMLEELNPKEIIFVVEKPLISIIATLNAKLTIIEKGKQLPSFDCYCPLLSMPLAFKTSLETVPAVIPYLKEDQVKQIYWAKKLGVKDLPRVGLVWSGSTAHKNDHNRSLRVSELSSLIRLPYEFHCLQKEIRECDKKELAKFKRLRLHHEDLKDFSDTAALIEQMDVVISVDTSVAHLAGALGKRVIILLPFMPDYRWMLDRDDTPWYPSAKLMRQKKIDDWKSVIKSLDRELKKLNEPSKYK